MLAVAGGKGGAGKTTTTLGLAAALGRQRRTVVAVDADREMPDLHAMAGVARTPGLDAVAEGWPVELVAGAPDPPLTGVEVLPAGTGPPSAGSAARVGERSGGATPLARARGVADAVLLDCPAGAGSDAVAPLRVADAAVVVTTTEPDCLRDAAKTAAMARELDAPVVGAVVSRADEVPVRIEQLLGCPVLGVVPEAGTDSRAEGVGRGVELLDNDGVRAAHDGLVSGLQPKYL
ncbi:P-loop NTPase [Halorussus gelatinilyticus]|uniref:P-loop NTPase n=1 Tax=Halorussus gelatinilyticus TaxID=2937524 RepID=A0A8U0IIK2_9EURY|nr:P-loop NTPase [Halorussus gelatinilyticus]UPW00102.1 P-loop NTPase [Halorussus gelatinilyticus]